MTQAGVTTDPRRMRTPPRPIPMCVCGEPLICTFAFAGAEFYCLDCGKNYAWGEPRRAAHSTTLFERLHGLLAEWEEHAAGLILTPGMTLTNCKICTRSGEAHVDHATDAEATNHLAALEWLRSRRLDTDTPL